MPQTRVISAAFLFIYVILRRDRSCMNIMCIAEGGFCWLILKSDDLLLTFAYDKALVSDKQGDSQRIITYHSTVLIIHRTNWRRR